MKHFLTKQRRSQQSYLYAFTIVELLIVIAIISILAGITAIGVSTWRTSVAETEVSSSIDAVMAGMEDARNGGDGYPVFTPGDEFDGSNDTKNIYIQNEYTTITYTRGTSSGYCVDVRSKAVPSVYMFFDTAGGNKTPQTGTCDGGIGATPPTSGQTVFVFDTTAPGCTGTVQLPVSSPTSGGTVRWGDGTTESRSSSLMTHTYGIPGRYTVVYDGPITQASYYSSVNSTNAKCLTRVNQWGEGVQPTRVSFYRASNLAYVAEPPRTVTNMSYMFYDAAVFNQDISSWDTSAVTNMALMFYGNTAFNQPIGNWNVSNVTTMQQLFTRASSFNQPLTGWNTAKVTNMHEMFAYTSFNQPLNHFNTSNVTNMEGVFGSNSAFNQPLDNWNTAKVTNMSRIFGSATAFNQPIGNWNTSRATTMVGTFYNAKSFNQPLTNWDTSKVTGMTQMFYDADAFNQPLAHFDTSNVTAMNDMFMNNDTFNQPIGNWNTSKVVFMQGMFSSNRAFNQNIAGWDTSSVTNMTDMFRGLSPSWQTSFNQNISGWNTNAVTSWTNFRQYSPLSTANTPPKFL